MIRRRFLNLFALLPFAGGATAVFPAKAAPAAGLLPGRVDLLLRMGRIHALRRMLDAADGELSAIQAEYIGFPSSDSRWRECIERSQPVYMRAEALEDRLQALEREPIDPYLMGDPAVHPHGALWAMRGDARPLETRVFREDELVTLSVVRVPA